MLTECYLDGAGYYAQAGAEIEAGNKGSASVSRGGRIGPTATFARCLNVRLRTLKITEAMGYPMAFLIRAGAYPADYQGKDHA
ncbi:MAG: hypothetical protein P1P74_10110 [Desulfuromonadales bacterium]|nr:hypothetical protein [Desulfuromonadales bacterium]